jgi:hypothetical protein
MPTYQITYRYKRKKGTMTETAKVFAMCQEHARKILLFWAKNTLKKFVEILNIEEK